MKIEINGQDYLVPAEEELLLLRQMQQMMQLEYEKISELWRLAIKPLARKALYAMEEDARKKHGKEKALLLRPAKGEDPCVHLSLVLLAVLQEAMNHVSFQIDHDCCVVSRINVAVAGETQDGRQVAIDGHDRIGENNSTQVS